MPTAVAAPAPRLMDDVWIYGGDAPSIFETISKGRPNGMPAFGKRIPKDQIWALVAYVRSMSGLAPQDAAPNRDDAFLTRTPESFMDPQKPETREAIVGERPAAMNGIHDVRVPAGPQAAALFDLWNVMLVTCAVVFVRSSVALASPSGARRARPSRRCPIFAAHPRWKPRCGVRSAMRSPCRPSLLFVLLFASFIADRAIATLPPRRCRPHRSRRASILVGGALRPYAIPRGRLRPPTSCMCRSDAR